MKKLLLLFFLMTISLGHGQGAAPTPSARNSWDVVSLYSDSFTSVSSTWHPAWGQTTVASQESLSGNSAEKLANFGYEGFTTGAQNLTAMTSLHVDVYSVNESSIKIYLLIGGEPMVQKSLVQGQWNSFDIPMSDFGAGSKAAVTGFKFESGTYSWPNGVSTVYLDNIYFYRAATSQPATLGALTVPAKLVGAAPFALTPPTTNSAGAFTYTSSNTAVATISGSTVTVVGAGTSIITANQAADSSYTSASTSANLVVSYPPPTVAATTPPTRNASNVISIFSGAYTDITGTDFFPYWGQSTAVSDYTVAGNVTKKYSNLNYQGTNLGPINVSLMTNLHLDIWTPDCASFDFYLINENIGETKVTLTPTLSGWNSFDIPMSSYSARNLTAINQFKFVGTTGSTVYLDNIYFWKPEGSPTITGFSIPSKVVGGASFSLIAPTSDSSGTFSYTSSNTSVATISGITVTIVGIGTSTITATQAAGGGFSSGFVTTDLIVTPPAAPTPTVASSHIQSLYSDAYTNVASINWNPNWGQSTQVSELSIGGNNTRKYSNLGYQGVQLNSPIDVSAMQTLHIDIWTPDCTTFSVFLINQPNPEKAVALTPTLSGWNSFDINLSEFTGAGGVNLANIGQLKFTGNGTVYVDNIYFSDIVVATAPTITFSNSIKLLGDANFVLSASSASTGAMTYSSSNTNVATISGATVTIVGVGTTTITVNQAAAGNYLVGTKTATLTVNPTTPTTAADTPPARNAWDVVSFYSDAYAAQTVTDWNPGWGQGTVLSDETIAGNATKLLSNFDYQGILTAATNVYPMDFLHIDIWTPNCNSFQVFLIANGENAVTLTPTLSGWNRYDIDLTQYKNAGRNLLALTGFKLEAPQRGAPKVYYDNLYFWRAATTQPPTLGAFTVPAKVLGNGDFNLKPPTSNSLGLFTYSSNNTAVATIVGRRVTIVGVGTAIITATQAANGGYAQGQAFASLVVSYPGPTYAPANPTKNASRVISIFSDSYTNVSGTDFFPNWGQTTMISDYTVGGNTIKKYSNLNFQGTQFASPIDASSMEMLHLDIWTPDCTAINVSLISSGENAVTLNPTLSGWNSFDIDLTQYSNAGRNLATISQFKFERVGTGTKTVYLDNLYFYNNRTKVQASQWMTTLPALNTPIFANNVSNVTNYRFKVVANGETRTIETVNNGFYLKSLAGGALFNTTYKISVATKYNGNWGIYGEECDVSTPAVPATKVQASQCESTLPALNTSIFANIVENATKYRFKVVANGETRTIETVNNGFYLRSLTGGALYNTTYTISVATLYNNVWGIYGDECRVSTPAVPATKVQASQCESTLPALNTSIFANIVENATNYRFKVVANGETRTIETVNNGFYLRSLTGGALYNTAYTISVATKYNDVWGGYGDECIVRTPSNATRLISESSNEITATDLSVKVYPNPFTSNFKLDFVSSSDANVDVVVYDMIGRQLDRLQVESSEMNNLEIGNNYPSGVYNVIVTQGEEVKTLRVIKR